MPLLKPLTLLLPLVALCALAHQTAAAPAVVPDGLLIDYDFSRESLPGDDGLIRDLSGNHLDATLRPVSPSKPDLPRTGWLDHNVLQGDGLGGWIVRPAKIQALKQPGADHTMPFGLIAMDNGEIALIASGERKGQPTQVLLAFSADQGDTWTDFLVVPGASGRAMVFTYLGGPNVTFVSGRRYFSRDYGRTWPDSVQHPPTKTGMSFHYEGSAWVDRDPAGLAKAILELGWHYEPGKKWPVDDATVVFRRSVDGGRSWIDEVAPPEWKFEMTYKGKTSLRGVSEGAVARAANGDLVAALRSDIPPALMDGPHDDNLEGTSVSVSKDDGKTWSKMNFLFYAGRHHANLQRLPSGDLVCTMVVRVDVQHGDLAAPPPGGWLTTPRRGCDAVVSRDNGATWDVTRRYELDRFEYLRSDYWPDGKCGHIGASPLPDGSVISAYGNYLKGAAVLIKWKPDAEPSRPATAEDLKLEKPSSGTIYGQVAQRGKDYDLGNRRVILTGSSWIQIPPDDRLLALDGNATVELILRPEEQSGEMPVLLFCAGAVEGKLIEGFRIAYDQRDLRNNNQVLYSDQRVDPTPYEYTTQVSGRSSLEPFSPVIQQLAYVIRDGHGEFYRDGKLFSVQTESGSVPASLFRYVLDKGASKETVCIAVGGRPVGEGVSQKLKAHLFALRIYDRPLSSAELKRNLLATTGKLP
ncbi:MAG: sialidase family protein [Planctomycetota bacterium]